MEPAFRASLEEQRRCFQDPHGCNFDIIAAPGSPFDTLAREQIADLIATNQRAVPGHGDYRYVVDEVVANRFDGTALVTYCSRDSVTIFNVGDPADPADDLPVDEGILWSHASRDLELDESGQWRVVSGRSLESSREEDVCAE